MNYLHLLTLVFVAAKLFGAIDWSWWLVFMPSLVSAGVGIAILVGVLIAAIVAAAK